MKTETMHLTEHLNVALYSCKKGRLSYQPIHVTTPFTKQLSLDAQYNESSEQN